MGAQSFTNEYRGPLGMQEAYREVVEKALWEHGHGGYTGTIAETSGVVLDPKTPKPVSMTEAFDRSEWYDRDYEDQPEKWGPAWAVPLLPDADTEVPNWGVDRTQPGWVFYGLASS